MIVRCGGRLRRWRATSSPATVTTTQIEIDLQLGAPSDGSLMLAIALSLPMPPVPPVSGTASRPSARWGSVPFWCPFAVVGFSQHFAIDIDVAQGPRALGIGRSRICLSRPHDIPAMQVPVAPREGAKGLIATDPPPSCGAARVCRAGTSTTAGHHPSPGGASDRTALVMSFGAPRTLVPRTRDLPRRSRKRPVRKCPYIHREGEAPYRREDQS